MYFLFLLKQYCYWPNSNVKRKIQTMSLPDKDLWKKYRYRKIGQGDIAFFKFKNPFLNKLVVVYLI